MFRYPYAIRHYYFSRSFDFAVRKAIEFATQSVSRQEAEWFVNYCRRIPFAWQEDK